MGRTTVVIPNYNGMKYIADCLDSLFCAGNVKVIVVDNGSLDGSREFLQQEQSKYPELRLICLPENKGFSAAVNIGIKEADTEYVFLLNNDTKVEQGAIEALEKTLDENIKYFAAAAKMVSMKEPDRLDGAGDSYCALGWAYARGKDKPAENYSRRVRVFSACAGAAMYRRNLFEKIGYFDENHFAYLEDLDVCYRANLAGYQSIFVPEAVVLHAGSGVSGSRHNEFKVNLSSRNSIYLILKNMPFLQIVLNIPFLILGYLVKTLFFLRKGLGGTYLKGIGKGFALYFSRTGRKEHVRFNIRNTGHYLWVQGQLWINMLRFW